MWRETSGELADSAAARSCHTFVAADENKNGSAARRAAARARCAARKASALNAAPLSAHYV
jgi:hypothetical protein